MEFSMRTKKIPTQTQFNETFSQDFIANKQTRHGRLIHNVKCGVCLHKCI